MDDEPWVIGTKILFAKDVGHTIVSKNFFVGHHKNSFFHRSQAKGG